MPARWTALNSDICGPLYACRAKERGREQGLDAFHTTDSRVIVYLNRRASRSDSISTRMSSWRTGPLTLRTMERVGSSRNSTRTCTWTKGRVSELLRPPSHKLDCTRARPGELESDSKRVNNSPE